MPDLETSLSYCTYCPKLCRHACPVSSATALETLVPQNKMMVMRHLAVEPVEDATALYGCTGCGACTEACVHGIDVAGALFSGRRDLEERGRGDAALRDLPVEFAKSSQALARQVREVVPLLKRPAEAQVAFFPGCAGAKSATAMLTLAQRIGAGYLAVADLSHGCAGYPLYAAGRFSEFAVHAHQLARDLEGFGRVVVHCPACAYVMKHEYASFGVKLHPTVEHTVEFLESFAERLPITQPRRSAFYHDPCYLGRQLGLHQAPRRLASRAVQTLHEFSRARSESECCGGGGLMPKTMPEAAKAMAEERLREVKQAACDLIVTASSMCQSQLARDGVAVVDLIDLLVAATA